MERHHLTTQPGTTAPYQHTSQVITAYQQVYPDPLAITTGDIVTLSGKIDLWNDNPAWRFLWCVNRHGKGGWVPAEYIEQQGATGTARQEYNCIELTVAVGEAVTTGATVCGWVWCANLHGQYGWVPLACLSQAD